MIGNRYACRVAARAGMSCVGLVFPARNDAVCFVPLGVAQNFMVWCQNSVPLKGDEEVAVDAKRLDLGFAADLRQIDDE